MRCLRKGSSMRPLGIVLALGLALCRPSFAEDPPVAAAVWDPSVLTLTLQAPGEFLLTVTGPGFDSQTRGAGLLSFSPRDANGLSLQDGLYHYELREIVTNAIVEEWEKVADYFEREALRRQLVREGLWPAPPRIQQRSFRIEAGRIVEPEKPVEARPDRSPIDPHHPAHPQSD